MVFAARLTQRGHRIATMDDLMALYEKSFSDDTVAAISALPHPTVQKFAVITAAVVGASRRFLSQITRHQNEVKFAPETLPEETAEKPSLMERLKADHPEHEARQAAPLMAERER